MSTYRTDIRSQQPAVIYSRVSGVKQATTGHGLDSQETRCRDHAERQGYVVEAVFPDDVSGGGDFMKRPGMVALLSYLDAQKDKSYVVIFDDLKRFARDTEFHIQLRRAFKQRGAQVECLNFRFEDTPEGKFHETIVAAHGELEREQNRRQAMQKTKARLESGYNTFPPPVGYRWGKVAPHGKLYVRNEPEASIVVEALEEFASGRFASQAEVQRWLEDQPAFPKAAGGRVRPQRVTDILTRPVYAGFVEHEAWGVTRRRGHHEALISAETYQRIQDIRAGRTKISKRADLGQDFILRGAVLCAECDAPYRSAWSKGKYKKYAYYVCQTKTCESYGKSIPRAQVESAFEDIFERHRTDFKHDHHCPQDVPQALGHARGTGKCSK
ncbi:recombinase family protein [Roseobacter sp. MH60115]|uniref:recombinase family protein n=1 Tax=Roseobacter sp. MH60115 TaxID=2785324 RepID=UPI0018A30545|nr:recombinase family protein [Roseobacter sp. MH60115]